MVLSNRRKTNPRSYFYVNIMIWFYIGLSVLLSLIAFVIGFYHGQLSMASVIDKILESFKAELKELQ